MRIKTALMFSVPVVVSGSLIAAGLAARRLTTPAFRETQFLTPLELGLDFEDVTFTTSDGLKLSGWWLPDRHATRTVVVLCGYNSARQHVLGVSAGLRRGGANVLLFDNRGRGTSEGDYVSLGYYERLDALAAIDYARQRTPDLPLGVVGYSMGGAVGLMVAASDGRDGRIGALVVDSPFASQTALMKERLGDYTGPFAGVAFAVAKRFLRFDPAEVEPGRRVGDIRCPVMFVHGTEDETTKPEDSVEMHERVGGSGELWLVGGADHVGSYYRNREEYCRRINDFLGRHLGGQEPG